MTELSKSDQELVKLRAAKMSTKTIAMLMGGRWTEAKVHNRLALIDGQVEVIEPALPALHRIDEDLPEEPAARPPSRMAPWMASAVSYLDPFPGLRPNAVFIGSGSGGKTCLAVNFPNFPSVVAEHLVAAPFAVSLEDLPDARTTADQSPPVIAAAPDPQPADASAQARPLRAVPAQADGAQAPQARALEEAPEVAPNPLAVHASPIVPVLPVRRRKAPARAVAAPAPNLLAPAPPPPRSAPRGGAMRLKPLTEKVTAYAARFVAANWPIDEIAGLFDVSPEALEKVLG